MAFLRPTSMFRSTALRPLLSTAPRARVQVRFAGGYGDGEGDPAGEKPEQQGKNPKGHLEHPGPEAPKVGKSQSSSPDEKSAASQSSSASKGGGSSDKSSGASSKSVKGAQPKILNENPPASEDESQSVKQHNEEMDNRAERAHEQVSNEDAKNDKVPKKYWSGTGGRDSNP